MTPLPTANRPGLSALSYRAGTHVSFLETMLARLSSSDYPKLRELSTRDPSDPAIALLDAWATVADVLTFYQERIANEGYLRTATERRSILELARLVGYKLRPGVAASVYLAYTLDDNATDEVVIPTGARSQSVPGPGELPQSFEISEDLKARAKWNNLKPRMTQPQTAASITGDSNSPRIYLKGISTNLEPNDPLLIKLGSGDPKFMRAKEVKPDAVANRTLVTLQSEPGAPASTSGAVVLSNQVSLVTALTLPASVQPANSLRLVRKLEDQFSTNAEAGYATVSAFAPVLRETLAIAAANAKVADETAIKVYALRVKAPLFGHNAQKRQRIQRRTGEITVIGEWPIVEVPDDDDDGEAKKHEEENAIYLDTSYDQILPGSWIIVDTSAVPLDNPVRVAPAKPSILISTAKNIQLTISRAEYGISGQTTRLELATPWITFNVDLGGEDQTLRDRDFQIIRRTIVYAQSEELELAEEPIVDLVCGGTDELIELDGFYEALEAGRWVVVSGERDIPGTSAVKFSELAMLASVEQRFDAGLPGDKTHTFIKLAEELQYCFKRDTVIVYGNMVKGTHGETRKEVLGSGDGAKVLQSFTLKQPPLTFVSAPNPSGVDSTLKVFVNDIKWHETDALAGLAPTDRSFITKTDDEGKTTVIFGNGKEGARLPTGIENIKSEYRNGIGKPGNVKAGQISLLVTRPLGVKEVINPLRASGGADKEGRDQARKNAPLAVKALDRLVSVQDYADFARTYAGIGKARAEELSDGRRQLVHVTIAGADDIPIDETSELFQNLRRSLLDFGDPYQPIQLAVRELMFIVISANVRIHPDYQWEKTEPTIRAALLEAFGFERRELGQDVLLSELIRVTQGARGVTYVDVDAFGGIPEKKLDQSVRRLLTPEEISAEVQILVQASEATGRPGPRLTVNLAAREGEMIRPAQLAFLTPDVPATLILNQIA